MSKMPTTHSDGEAIAIHEKTGEDGVHILSKDVSTLQSDESLEDHEHEPPMTMKRIMSLIAMAFLWTGSQIPVYLFGGIPPLIYADIGGADRWIWFVLAYLLALAAVCPFVGSISDIIGRRFIALVGASLLVIGMIVSSTAQSYNNFIAGMALAGAGAGINELTALAATSEMAPTRKRGTYVAVLIFTILPFTPSVLWAQLIATSAGWRYVGLLCGVWNAVGLFMTLAFYFPPPRTTLPKVELLKRIDWVGGFLSVTGMIIFLAGMQWGGYMYPWSSAHVLAPLVIGFSLLVAYVIWEWKFAKFPMFPRRLLQAPRTMMLTLVITFISGANFISILLFWPTQAFNVYGHDPVEVGIRGLPIGFGILVGACVTLWLLSVLRGRNRTLMIGSSVLMTAGCGAMAAAEVYNMNAVYGFLTLAGLGIGGIVVPASIITTIICPDDLIATVSAGTLALRVLGGCVGYTIYYNVFFNKFVERGTHYIGGTMVAYLNITSPALIEEAITLTGASLLDELRAIPGLESDEAWTMVVEAGKIAFAESYKYVYYVSILFGVLSIVASCFLGDIEQFMTDHVAVVMH